MNDTTPEITDVSVTLNNDGVKAVIWAKEFRIDDNDDYELAGRVLVEIKKRLKAVKEYWQPMKQAADRAKREILDKEQEMVERFEDAGRLVSVPVVVAPKVSGLSFRTTHKCECTNELLVPDQYKSVDMAKIRAAVVASDGKIEIPGVRVWSEQTPIARTT